MKKTILKIDTIPQLEKRLKVAAYARVTTNRESMLNSLAAQVNYYKRLIQNNSKWEFAGVYADEGITGTISKRDEFQLMLEHCKKGKIDMIITKSISRFARNTLTLLKTIRKLKELNIDVYFEEQNINTLSGEGEMILTLLATMAQEESRSTSENMKWRIKKDFEKGLIWGGKDSYGYKIENKTLVLIPEEAKVVKLIFDLYLKGDGYNKIARILTEKGYKPKKSKTWNPASIRTILNNSNYTGDLTLQKSYRENHLTKTKIINNGEFDKYFIKNNHEPIISKEDFFAVQELIKQKTSNIKKSNNNSIFKGRIRCGLCGKMYTFRKTKYNDAWICSTYRQRGPSACKSKQVLDKKVIEASNRILQMSKFKRHIFDDLVEEVIVLPDNKLVFKLNDGTEEEYVWEYKSRSNSWTEEMRKEASIRQTNRMKGGTNNG